MMYLGNNPVGVNQVLLMNEIDDTAGIGDTNKTYSADKISRDLNSKLSAPSSIGSVGQVLTSDGGNGQNWTSIIDNTLTESGMAADAAATGAVKSILNDIATNRVESAQMIDPTKYVAGYMWNNGWDDDNYVGSTIDDDPVEDSFWTIVNQKWFLGEDKVIGFNYKTPNIQILCYTYDPQLEDYALYTTRTANNCTTDGDHYQLTLSDEIDAIRIYVASEWLSGLTDPIIMAMNTDWDGNSAYGSSPASIRSDIQIAQVNSLRTELMSALNTLDAAAVKSVNNATPDENGNVTVEIDQEYVAEAVEDWLDDHPEATTTVEDGSITEAKLANALAEKVEYANGLRKIVEVTPTVVSGLNFVHEATAYSSANNFRVDYFPVKAGQIYYIECYDVTSSSRIAFRQVVSSSIPAAGVSGTEVREVGLYTSWKKKYIYQPQEDAYFGIAYYNHASYVVNVTCEEGIVPHRLLHDPTYWEHYLHSNEFMQGTINDDAVLSNNTDCVTQIDFQPVDGSYDKILFEEFDSDGKWKIRVEFYNERGEHLSKIGYDFLTSVDIPPVAKFYRMAVSHYTNEGAGTATTPSTIKPNTLRVSLHKTAHTLKKFTGGELDQVESNGYGFLHGDFIDGNLSSGNVNPALKYRVTSYDKFVFDHDIVLIPDDDYRFGVHSFGTTGSSFVSDSGWQYAPYTISAGTYFRIVIEKRTSDTTQYANIHDHVTGVKVRPKLASVYDKLFEKTITGDAATYLNYVVNASNTVYATTETYFKVTYYRIEAGIRYHVKLTMGAEASNIRIVFSEKIPANNVEGVLNREIKCEAGQVCEFDFQYDKCGYLGFAYYYTYEPTLVVKQVSVDSAKRDIGILEGAQKVSYEGERIDTRHYVAPEYLFVIADGIPTVGEDSKNRARQGACVYGDILFVGYNGGEAVSMHNLKTKRHICNVTINEEWTSTYHCNNLNFGTERYDESDPFPLLYISMENAAERKTLVYRITGADSSYSATLVQTIAYPAQASDGLYYPNGFIDNEHGYFYIHGYTENSFSESDTNKIKIVKYAMPLLSAGDVQLDYADKLDEFVMDSYTATQGCCVRNNKMYQAYGYGSTDNHVAVNDLVKGKTVSNVSLNKMGITNEPEAAFIWDDALCFYTVYGYVYKLHFD